MPAQTPEQKQAELEQDARDAQDVVTEYIPPAPAKGKGRSKKAKEEQESREDKLDLVKAEADFTAMLDTPWPILGTVVGVQCTVPGYEWLKVWFRISNQHWIAKLFRQVPAVDNLIFTIFPLFVQGLEVAPSEAATPTEDQAAAISSLDPSKPETYQMLFDHAFDLLMWMRNGGYDEALKKPVGN